MDSILDRVARYESASQGCLRAMTDDESLTVVFGDMNGEPDQNSIVSIPLLARVDDAVALARHRGLIDSYVFMRQFHDTSIHDDTAPADSMSERLYNLLERERFEAIGANLYQGSNQNMTALWNCSHTPELIDRFGGGEQLEWVISCLCREKLLPHSLPESQLNRIAPLRGPIEALIGPDLNTLAQCTHNQQEYAKQAILLIGRLGFNTDPAYSEGKNQSLADEIDASEQSEQVDELADATEFNVQPEESGELQSDSTNDDELTIVVRNTDTERGVEPTPEELDCMAENTPEWSGPSELTDSSDLRYRVFDDQNDEVINALDLVHPSELSALKKQLDLCVEQHAYLVRQLTNRLQRYLLARQQRHWQFEQEEGELDTRRLSRLITEPLHPLSFRIESEASVRSTVVSILVDNSRSMLGRPMELAAVCAELLTRTLERCGVKSEVLGYTTVSMYGGATKARWQQNGECANPGRLNSIRHIVYKPAAMPWRRAKERFAVMLKTDVLKQNIDGEAIQWAHDRLMAYNEDKRLLIVVSDGAPSDAATLSANSKDLLCRHLHDVVQRIEKKSPVQLMAIGIGHDVSDFFTDAMVIHNADDLGATLLSGLTQMLSDDGLGRRT